jgi:hypothetical protein
LLRLALNYDTPDLCLPSSWDYRHKPASSRSSYLKEKMQDEVGGGCLRGDKQTMKGRGHRDEFFGGQGRNSSFTRGF